MKHTWTITLYLLLLFLATQLLGLWLLSKNVHVVQEDGKYVLLHEDTVLGPRPETTGATSFLYILFAVLIGTILVLLLIKYRNVKLWRIWYGLACFLTLSIALGVLLPNLIAFAIGAILTYLKLRYYNLYTHNLTEILIYAGIGVFLAPILDVKWATILLISIALYDMYAVWRSKHMIEMAKFQTQTKLFSGLSIPYKTIKPLPHKISTPHSESQTAILGGGDIAFPLLFTGTAMESILSTGQSIAIALSHSTLIVLGSTLALLILFLLAKKNRFYPAMPFIAMGCFVGYGVMLFL